MYLIFTFLIYNLIQFVMFPLFLTYLIVRKMRDKDVVGNLWQRLGFVSRSTSNKKIIWLHAVSVGEVLSVQQLITDIKKNDPEIFCYLTVGTSTGMQMAKKNLQVDCISFLPYDFLPCVMLALQRIKPTTMIIVEAEIWPNLLILSSWFGIDKILINARVSTRSYKRYQSLKFFFAPIFNTFKTIYTQSNSDLERFLTLGVDSCRLSVFGDIKAYNVVQKKLTTKILSQKLSWTVLLVGSIHPGELDYYLNLFIELKKINPRLKMILATRHFIWTDELELKLKNKDLHYNLWTTQSELLRENENLAEALERAFKDSDVICVCKLGELFNLYQFADIFYLGGTFVNVGGHNLLEPAAWGNPCIVGPHHQNTKNNADEMERVGGLIKVEDYNALKDATQKLLSNAQLRIKMGNSNLKWIEDIASKPFVIR